MPAPARSIRGVVTLERAERVESERLRGRFILSEARPGPQDEAEKLRSMDSGPAQMRRPGMTLRQSALGCADVLAAKHRARKSPGRRDLALSAAAQAQSGGLVAVGAGRLGRGQAQQPADPALGRLRRLPLVPRDGARVVRGRADRKRDERAVRQHQSRPRGAAGHRPDLHERAASLGRAGRLAADHVSHARGRAGVGRHLFSQRVALRPAGLHRYPARGGAAVPRGAEQDRAEPRVAAGAAGRQGAAGGQGHDRSEGARRGGAAKSATCSMR